MRLTVKRIYLFRRKNIKSQGRKPLFFKEFSDYSDYSDYSEHSDYSDS